MTRASTCDVDAVVGGDRGRRLLRPLEGRGDDVGDVVGLEVGGDEAGHLAAEVREVEAVEAAVEHPFGVVDLSMAHQVHDREVAGARRRPVRALTHGRQSLKRPAQDRIASGDVRSCAAPVTGMRTACGRLVDAGHAPTYTPDRVVVSLAPPRRGGGAHLVHPGRRGDQHDGQLPRLRVDPLDLGHPRPAGGPARAHRRRRCRRRGPRGRLTRALQRHPVRRRRLPRPPRRAAVPLAAPRRRGSASCGASRRGRCSAGGCSST